MTVSCDCFVSGRACHRRFAVARLQGSRIDFSRRKTNILIQKISVEMDMAGTPYSLENFEPTLAAVNCVFFACPPPPEVRLKFLEDALHASLFCRNVGLQPSTVCFPVFIPFYVITREFCCLWTEGNESQPSGKQFFYAVRLTVQPHLITPVWRMIVNKQF